MAPLPFIDSLLHKSPPAKSTHWLHVRDLPPEALTGVIVILVILSSLVIVFMTLLLGRAWKWLKTPRLGLPSPEVTGGIGMSQRRKTSDWARQNSNILWSLYIQEDDLRAQFAAPSKLSRLFSIGSASSDHGRCPLDRRPSVIAEDGLDRLIDEKNVANVEVNELRSCAAYEYDTSPARKFSLPGRKFSLFQAKPPKPRHRYTRSLEDVTRISQPSQRTTSRNRKLPARCYEQIVDENESA